ncbi:transposase [Sorangium atrum]|uniref:transposase n=1 Tax=Sorangium atrum TaxID=2995308 RepID=UPI00358DAC4E
MERTRSPANARGRSGHRARRRADAPLPPAARASRDRARRRGGRRARGSALCFRRLGTRAAPYVVAPQWLRGLSPSSPSALAYDKPLCAALDGFTLHAATRAGAHHAAAREALLRYVLRPPIAKERVEPQQDGLVRLSLKRAFADGTVAVDMDPLSLLCRLAASVPPPRFHTVKYAGVLASASPWRKRIGPRPAKPQEPTKADEGAASKRKRGGYRAVDKPRRAPAPHICDRRPRVPSLQGADEARRHGDRAKEHRPLPLRARRTDRRPSTLSQRRGGGRRTGRAPFCAARRPGTPPRFATRLPGQTKARTDTCAHGTPMRPVARSAPPGPRSFDPGPSHHDARGPTLSVCCATLLRAAIRLLLPTRYARIAGYTTRAAAARGSDAGRGRRPARAAAARPALQG